MEGAAKGRRGKGAAGRRQRQEQRELTSPSANFITELVVFAQIISIYSTQAGNLFASECMREWNLPRSQRPPMCASVYLRATPCFSMKPAYTFTHTVNDNASFLRKISSRLAKAHDWLLDTSLSHRSPFATNCHRRRS